MKALRKQKPFKTLMMSFKNGLRVYTPSNVIADALMIDFGSQNASKISSKSLPKRFQRASEGALDEDSEVMSSSGVPFGLANASGLRLNSKTPAILEENSVQNRSQTASKPNQIGFQAQSDNMKRFATDFT